MPNQVAPTAAGERTGFSKWALVVGCLYASVTFCVVAMAVVRVTAAEPGSITGYAAAVSAPVEPEALVGDFWPASVRVPLPLSQDAGA